MRWSRLESCQERCSIMCEFINSNEWQKILQWIKNTKSTKWLSMNQIGNNSSCRLLLRSFQAHFPYLTLIQQLHAFTAGWKRCSIFCKYPHYLDTDIYSKLRNDLQLCDLKNYGEHYYAWKYATLLLLNNSVFEYNIFSINYKMCPNWS